MSKKPKYRLQTVLEMRERAKEDAAQAVAERRRQLEAEEQQLRQREADVEANIARQKQVQREMQENFQIGVAAARAASFRQHLKDLRDTELDLRAAVVMQQKRVAQAEMEVERALQFLAECAKEVKAIEKHKENWQTELKLESERREQKLNDEIGSILYENIRRNRQKD